jgi:hypothetical protein
MGIPDMTGIGMVSKTFYLGGLRSRGRPIVPLVQGIALGKMPAVPPGALSPVFDPEITAIGATLPLLFGAYSVTELLHASTIHKSPFGYIARP